MIYSVMGSDLRAARDERAFTYGHFALTRRAAGALHHWHDEVLPLNGALREAADTLLSPTPRFSLR